MIELEFESFKCNWIFFCPNYMAAWHYKQDLNMNLD